MRHIFLSTVDQALGCELIIPLKSGWLSLKSGSVSSRTTFHKIFQTFWNRGFFFFKQNLSAPTIWALKQRRFRLYYFLKQDDLDANHLLIKVSPLLTCDYLAQWWRHLSPTECPRWARESPAPPTGCSEGWPAHLRWRRQQRLARRQTAAARWLTLPARLSAQGRRTKGGLNEAHGGEIMEL